MLSHRLPYVVQVGARIVKAGPDNATVYMTGMGIMYKEHEILVEVNNDGSGVICEYFCLCLAAVPLQLHPYVSNAYLRQAIMGSLGASPNALILAVHC